MIIYRTLTRWVLLTVLLLLVSSCGKGPEGPRYTWISREDNGDKPGIEIHVWHDEDGSLLADMWLYVWDEESQRDSERGQYPIRILSSDTRTISIRFPSEEKSSEDATLTFSEDLKDPVHMAVMSFATGAAPQDLTFSRVERKN